VARGGDDEADKRIVSMEALIGPTKSWASLPDTAMPDADIGPDDDATIMYTSGTTGKPKGALATHRGIVSNVFNGMACQARHFVRQGLAPPVRDPKVDAQRVAPAGDPILPRDRRVFEPGPVNHECRQDRHHVQVGSRRSARDH